MSTKKKEIGISFLGKEKTLYNEAEIYVRYYSSR